MAWCRFPEICDIYKIEIGIYDPRSKRILPRTVKQREKCVHVHKRHYCVIWKKNREDSLLNGVEEIDKNLKHVKNKKKKIFQNEEFVIDFQSMKH